MGKEGGQDLQEIGWEGASGPLGLSWGLSFRNKTTIFMPLGVLDLLLVSGRLMQLWAELIAKGWRDGVGPIDLK